MEFGDIPSVESQKNLAPEYRYLEIIKNQLGLNDEYNTYQCNYRLFISLFELEGVKKIPHHAELRLETKTKTKVDGLATIKVTTSKLQDVEHGAFKGVLYHDLFTAVRVESDDYGTYQFIFIKDKNIPALGKLVATENVEEKLTPLAEPGLYTIEYTMLGPRLKLLNPSECGLPILNGTFEDSFREDLKAFINSYDLYKEANMEFKRGYLLYGPPGNGKTALIKNVLKEIKEVVSIIVSQPDDIRFVEDFINKKANKGILKIIILEDLDSLTADLSNRSRILNMLDGITDSSNTVFIGTTNYPEKMDSAFVERPSRFDIVQLVDNPNDTTRRKIIDVHYGNSLTSAEKDELIILTKNYSGAAMKELRTINMIEKKSPVVAAQERNKRDRSIKEFIQKKNNNF